MTARRLRLILAGTIAILVAIVVLQNTESVETRILFASIVMPRALLLFVTALIGVVVGFLLGARAYRRSPAGVTDAS